MPGPVITLLSDFGLADGYAAAMKGVILGICPGACLIDITHLIPAQDIRAGAYVLSTVYRYFPGGAIHLAVVDPGVGTSRTPLVIRCGGFFFVGPDNGIFSLVLAREPEWEARSIGHPAFMLPEVSSTFHGRDLFAPAAAHLAAGAPFESFGREVHPIPAAWSAIKAGKDQVRGEVLHVDHFGTAITNVRPEHLEQASPLETWTLRAAGADLVPVLRTYSDAPPGKPLALVGSSGYIEIAVNRGSAAALYGIRPGDEVRCIRKKAPGSGDE